MKSLKHVLCLVLALSLTVVLFGCGGSGGSDTDKFIGTWRVTMDMTDSFNDSMVESAGDVGEYFRTDSFDVAVLLVFDKDGTYSMSLDRDVLNKSMDNFKGNIESGFTAYIEDMIADQGLDMSVEDVLALSGMSFDDIIDEFDKAIGPEMESIFGEVETEGKWKIENGKLYTTTSVGDDFDEDDAEAYKITSAGIELQTSDEYEEIFGTTSILLKKVK